MAIKFSHRYCRVRFCSRSSRFTRIRNAPDNSSRKLSQISKNCLTLPNHKHSVCISDKAEKFLPRVTSPKPFLNQNFFISLYFFVFGGFTPSRTTICPRQRPHFTSNILPNCSSTTSTPSHSLGSFPGGRTKENQVPMQS